MRKRTLMARSLGLALVLAGCCLGDSSEAAPPDIKSLKSAPEKIRIGRNQFALECYLWRDFAPGGPAGGTRLIASVTVKEVNGKPIPAGLRATYLWALNGNKVWATRFSEEPRPPAPPAHIEKVAREGPGWEPGTAVDVIVRMADAKGKTYLLRARNQRIARTM